MKTTKKPLEDERKQHKNESDAYNLIVSMAVNLKSCYVRNGIFSAIRSVRDIDSNIYRSFLHQFPLLPNHQFQSNSFLPIELSNTIKARIPSPSGQKMAILIETTKTTNNKQPKKQQMFEIWHGSSLIHRIPLSHSIHGPVCIDTTWFGSISWNPVGENILVYCAETKLPKTQSFFDIPSSTNKNNNNNNNNERGNEEYDDEEEDNVVVIGGEHTLGIGKVEDWGEKYTDMAKLSLFCLHIDTGKIECIQNVPGGKHLDNKKQQQQQQQSSSLYSSEGGYTLGQPIFSPCGTSVIYTGWDAGGGGFMPRRLGSIYCYQRPCKIYSSNIVQLMRRLSSPHTQKQDDDVDDDDDKNKEHDEAYICLTSDDRLARSPRFSRIMEKNDSDVGTTAAATLAYLCNTQGFETHGGCMALHTMNWNIHQNGGTPDLSSRRILVDVVRVPSSNVQTGTNANDSDAAATDAEQTTNSEMICGLSFPGLFINQLPIDCFTIDGKSILLTSQWGSISKIIQINLLNGSLRPLRFDVFDNDDDNRIGKSQQEQSTESSSSSSSSLFSRAERASQTMLCMTEMGGIVVTQSEPNYPPVVAYLLPQSVQLDTKKGSGHIISADMWRR